MPPVCNACKTIDTDFPYMFKLVEMQWRAKSELHILWSRTVSAHQLDAFEWIFNSKLTQFWQSNTRHTVTEQVKAMFWHWHIFQIVWIRVCFLCRGKESRARTTSGPGDRITPNVACSCCCCFFSPPFFFFPQTMSCLCSTNLCNVLNNDIIMALVDVLQRQTSKQYTGGRRNGLHAGTYIILMRVRCERESEKGWCWKESEVNDHVLLDSAENCRDFFFLSLSSSLFIQSQEFSMTHGWTRKLLPWSWTHQELIKKANEEKWQESEKKGRWEWGGQLGEKILHIVGLSHTWSFSLNPWDTVYTAWWEGGRLGSLAWHEEEQTIKLQMQRGKRNFFHPSPFKDVRYCLVSAGS